MKINSKQKGFTLIEILVATAIFATVMVIVVGTFSWVAGYNNRLKETRRVGQEVRNVMDQLTRDIRLANGSGNVKIGVTNYPIGEITLMLCGQTALSANSTCKPVLQSSAQRYSTDLATTTDPTSMATPVSDALLLLKKDSNPPQVILYRSVVVDSRNRKLTMSVYENNNIDFNALDLTRDFPATSATALHPISESNAIINNPMSIQVYFGGYGATKGQSRVQQPYAEIYMIGKTYNYDIVQPNMRSKFHLRTMIESRDYNP